jgi:hypothetical protein
MENLIFDKNCGIFEIVKTRIVEAIHLLLSQNNACALEP